MSSINWARLLSQDRCKDIGVPWSPAEGIAIHKLKIPAEYVRAGIQTRKKYKQIQEEEDATNEKEVRFMSRSELVATLADYKTELTILAETPTAVIRNAVEVAIKNGEKEPDEAEEADVEEDEAEEVEDVGEVVEKVEEVEDEEEIEEEEEKIKEEKKVNASNKSRDRKRSRN